MNIHLEKTQYVLVEEQLFTPELGEYHSFGIKAKNSGGEDMDFVSDVSTDRAFVSDLVERCNRAEVSPIHLRDIIADALES